MEREKVPRKSNPAACPWSRRPRVPGNWPEPNRVGAARAPEPPSGIPPGCRHTPSLDRGSRCASTPGYLLSSLRDELYCSSHIHIKANTWDHNRRRASPITP